MSIYHQNSFSRTLANEGKMGAYYTDIEHCKSISKMFRFPEDEVCVIEPSVGDASAVIAVTNADKNSNIKIFGIELNDQTADLLRANPYVEDVLQADFLNDVFISNNAFSFCFGNPPYLNDSMNDEPNGRTERSFLEKVGNYLMTGAILVWIIPFYIYQEESYLRYWNSRYETLALYRFRSAEYKKFQQIVLVGRKRRLSVMLSKEQMANYMSAVTSSELIPELPDIFPEKIDVLPSPISAITTFATRNFDASLAYKALQELPNELLNEFDSRVAVKPFAICNIGKPPIPLKKDSMYLLATSGGGQGLTGSEETNDLHLQRGVAEIIEESVIETSGTGKNAKTQERVTSRTQVSMTVIQNNGNISKLA